MEDVLHAVDHRRPVGALGDVDDALQAQEIGAAVLGQGLQQQRQRDSADRLLAQDGEAGDAGVVGGVVVMAARADVSHRGRARLTSGRLPSAPAPCRTAAPGRRRRRSPSSTVAAGLSAARRSTSASASPSDEIGLGQHQAVGDRHLLHRLGLPRERVEAVDGIDRRHHAGEGEPLREAASVISACRIGAGSASPLVSMTTRSNGATVPCVAPPQHVLQRPHQVAADRAAQAAGLQLDEALLAGLDQLVVEPDLAELVDDHGRARELRAAQQPRQQRGLAAAEKAGEHRHGDHGGSTGAAARCAPAPARSRDRCAGPHAARSTASNGDGAPRVRLARRSPSSGTARSRRRAHGCSMSLVAAASRSSAAVGLVAPNLAGHAPGREALRQQLADVRPARLAVTASALR